MGLIDNIIKLTSKNKKTIILPESDDSRIIEAAKIAVSKNICNIILIGDSGKLKELEGIKVIDPNIEKELTEKLADNFYKLRKNKGISLDEARKTILNDYMYYACMMLKEDLADGVVSGACHSTANTLRPALQIIKKSDRVSLVSSFFLMELKNITFGENGVLLFSDCGLVQDPNAEELANIAVSSAKSFEALVSGKAKVAMLSHSTKGSAKGELVDKVVSATNIAKQIDSSILIDGEMQLDAAIIPEVASNKAPQSKVAGNANVLIFPNIDAGNIGYKLVERLASAKAYGPLTQGLAKPVNDLSRGSSVEDIIGVIAITALQAIKK